MELNPQAQELNQKIKENNPFLYEMLSKRGKAIYFPKQGILAQSAEAKTKKINATIGIAIEDDGTPMKLNSISKNILLDPKEIFTYAPSQGKPELRTKWKQLMNQKNPTLITKTTSLPIVTNALTHGLSTTAYLFVDKNDEIIIPDPYWENYELIFANGCEAKIKTFDCFKNDRFNIEKLKTVLTIGKTNKKILLLNFPNNPSGYTPTEEEIKQIVGVIKETAETGKKVIVIIDDAYAGLVYAQGIYQESIFSQLADLHEKVLAIKLDAATKEDYVWGLRVGFITFAIRGADQKTLEALESKAAGTIRGDISNAPHISQSLLLNSFSSPDYESEKKQKYEILKQRFEQVKKTLIEHKEYKKYFQPLPYNSGYFMCIKLKKGLNAEIIRKKLLEKYDTGIIVFGNLIRIAYSAISKEKIPIIFENIYKACLEEQT